MDSIENKISNLPKPEQFIQNLENLNSQLPHILDEFKKYYVFFNKNPEYQEYQTNFENVKGNLNTINSQLFSLSNSVQSSTEGINKALLVLNIAIKKEREKNKELKRKLGIVEHKNNAASEMISDYQTIYDSGYLRNWALFFSIAIVGVGISKVFTKSATVTFA
jgi:chromosome segregation ATPase